MICKILKLTIINFLTIVLVQGLYSQDSKSIFGNYNTEQKNKALVKRKVLVLNFVDFGPRQDRAEYLSESIPEALIKSLKSTNSFEIIEMKTAKKLARKAGVHAKDYYNEANAIKIGKEANADVVVIGNYFVVTNKGTVDTIQIQSKAIDTHTGRNATTLTKSNEITASIFTTINQISSQMSKKMVKALPPLPKRDIERRRNHAHGKTYPFVPNLSVEALYSTPLSPSVTKILNPAMGLRVHYESTAGPANTLFFNIELSALISELQISQYALTTGTLAVGFSYPIPLGKNFAFSPYILAGAYIDYIFELDDYTISPVFKPGVNFKWAIRTFTLSFHIALPYYANDSGAYYAFEQGLGATFKF